MTDSCLTQSSPSLPGCVLTTYIEQHRNHLWRLAAQHPLALFTHTLHRCQHSLRTHRNLLLKPTRQSPFRPTNPGRNHVLPPARSHHPARDEMALPQPRNSYTQSYDHLGPPSSDLDLEQRLYNLSPARSLTSAPSGHSSHSWYSSHSHEATNTNRRQTYEARPQRPANDAGALIMVEWRALTSVIVDDVSTLVMAAADVARSLANTIWRCYVYFLSRCKSALSL